MLFTPLRLQGPSFRWISHFQKRTKEQQRERTLSVSPAVCERIKGTLHLVSLGSQVWQLLNQSKAGMDV